MSPKLVIIEYIIRKYDGFSKNLQLIAFLFTQASLLLFYCTLLFYVTDKKA